MSLGFIEYVFRALPVDHCLAWHAKPSIFLIRLEFLSHVVDFPKWHSAN